MNNYFYKIVFSSLACLLLLSGASCQKKITTIRSTSEAEYFENRFFTLDLENGSSNMSEVETHFFTTFPHDDPTGGNVVYDRTRWVNKNMFEFKNKDGLYLYLKSRNDSLGYDSSRLTTKAYFNLNNNTQKILFVFKGQLPAARGVWPAWWLNGSTEDTWTYKNSGYVHTDHGLDEFSGTGHFYDTPSAVNATDWPGAGEIDIVEMINGVNLIHNTIHTCPQMCDSEWNNDGKIINCANAKPDDPNSGCTGIPYKSDGFEGTFACLWEKTTIKFFYWSLEEDVRENGGPLSKNPDPDQWKNKNLKNEVRLLETETECNNQLHQDWQCKNCDSSTSCLFKNMKMIFNVTVCGKWAGSNFDSTGNNLNNCQTFIMGEGKPSINNQFLKIEYVSVNKL